MAKNVCSLCKKEIRYPEGISSKKAEFHIICYAEAKKQKILRYNAMQSVK